MHASVTFFSASVRRALKTTFDPACSMRPIEFHSRDWHNTSLGAHLGKEDCGCLEKLTVDYQQQTSKRYETPALRTAPIPALAPVTRTFLPCSREKLKSDMLRWFLVKMRARAVARGGLCNGSSFGEEAPRRNSDGIIIAEVITQ